MGLVITRSIGTGWYGGNDLDTKRPEETYTHKVWVHGINKGSQKVILYIESKDSESENKEEVQMIKVGSVLVLDDCIARLLEISSYNENGKNCVHARFKFSAPEEYIIIRNNAKKRTGKVIDLDAEHWEEQPCKTTITKEYARQ